MAVRTKVTRLGWYNDQGAGFHEVAVVPAGKVWRVRHVMVSAGPPSAVRVVAGIDRSGTPPEQAVDLVGLPTASGLWWASVLGEWDLVAGNRLYLNTNGVIFRGCLFSGWAYSA